MSIGVPWRKRLVACADCGYLSYRGTEKVWEMTPSDRSGDEQRGWPYWGNVYCFKYASDLFAEIKTAAPPGEIDYFRSADHTIIEPVLTKKRDCRFFCRYRPGYDPSLHRDLQDQERRDTAARVWNFVFVLVGGGLAVLGTVVALLLR